TITAANYTGMLAGILAIWCFGGIALMFFGTAITDTLGLVLTVAEAVFILMRDRVNFYNGAGFWKVEKWSAGQRALLAALEVPFYFLALAIYVVRVAALHYQRLEQPAPLTPPAKRKPPQR
ncbi:MAG: hypothetical protein ACRDID_01955, partial [Ktedonobacterales bacterium]